MTRVLITILITVSFCSCFNRTEYYYQEDLIKSLQNECRILKDSITLVLGDMALNEKVYYDSQESIKNEMNILKEKYDSLEHLCDINTYKLNRIEYYVDICAKNSKQKTYLYGWIRRVLQK
ncbi:putative peptidoglycan-binding domain-containing protein [uncultured Bacteroides sp.]|uniref:putative peptidoglycan-binding domain-containing protein n=1 Tax=uncultured Bacteroides sp. TaxID=162156 RepID=UPI002628CABF|nr:putative peptidoglycan-binding domain-containing protein [uncultured Bacteroides sp.]